jgi:dephospho-CoA kinase
MMANRSLRGGDSADSKSPPHFLVGLTGGIASGKSTVASMLGELGAYVLSADEASRAVMQPGSSTFERVVAEFGDRFVRPDGTLDRAALGNYVFANPVELKKLEGITHPAIRQWLRESIAQAPAGAIVVVETPLLFESGMEDWFDTVVVVTAPEAVQVERLVARWGISDVEARRRIALQLPLSEKAARGDVVIVNDGSLDSLRDSVKGLWLSLRDEPRVVARR